MKINKDVEPSYVKAVDLETKEGCTYKCYPCPNCGRWLVSNPSKRYCEWCGVKLEWE